MNEINWEPINKIKTIEPLTEEEKKIAEECSEIDMEIEEIILEIKDKFN